MAWIGVDLDGTLAAWGEGHNEDVRQIGEPISTMVAAVQGWLAAGWEVRIVTARVGPATDAECQAVGSPDLAHFVGCQRALIQRWCLDHLGQILDITAVKDFHMAMLYDDRAVTVQRNEGLILDVDVVNAMGLQLAEQATQIAHLEQQLAAYRRAVAASGDY